MTCPEPQRISLPPHPSQVPTAGYQPSPPPALRTDQPPTDTDRLHRHSGLSEPQHRHRKPPALNNNGNAAGPRAAPLRHPPGYRASIISIKSLCPPSARLQTPARGRNYRAVPAPGTGGVGTKRRHRGHFAARGHLRLRSAGRERKKLGGAARGAALPATSSRGNFPPSLLLLPPGRSGGRPPLPLPAPLSPRGRRGGGRGGAAPLPLALLHAPGRRRTKSGGGGDQFLIPIDGERRAEGEREGTGRGGRGRDGGGRLDPPLPPAPPPAPRPPPPPPTWSRRTSNRVRYRNIDPTSAAILGETGGAEGRGAARRGAEQPARLHRRGRPRRLAPPALRGEGRGRPPPTPGPPAGTVPTRVVGPPPSARGRGAEPRYD